MQTQGIFNPFWKFTNSPIDYFLFALFLILLILTLTLQTQKRSITDYNPRLAWIRGGIYFASCFILSIFTGVFSTLISKPIVTQENLSNPIWWAFTLVCVSVIYFAYFIIWRRGTLTHGRELHKPSVFIFGLLWGLSEGQLMLSIWAIVEKFSSNIFIIGIVMFGNALIFLLFQTTGLMICAYYMRFPAWKNNY